LYYGWLAIAGVVVSVIALVEHFEGRMEKEAAERKAGISEQAQRWPVAEGFVLHIDQSPDADGAPKVTLCYMYKVGEQEFFWLRVGHVHEQRRCRAVCVQMQRTRAQGSLSPG